MPNDPIERSPSAPRRLAITLGVGLALTAGAIGVTLAKSPLSVAGTNSVASPDSSGSIAGNSNLCVRGDTIPRDTVAIRIPFMANVGPEVSVRVMDGSRVSTSGARAAGWGISESVTVPVARLADAVHDARVCVHVGSIEPYLVVNGTLEASGSSAAQAGAEGLRLEYLRPAERSWWSLAPSIAEHLGLGHAAAGTWIVFLLLALMLVVALLASRLALGKGASAALVCAAVACLNAVCWSILTPPFQVPDEPSHFAYTQQLAENHRLPTSTASEYSPEENVVLSDLHWREIAWHPENRTISTASQQRRLERDLAEAPGRHGGGGVGVAASEPPLYYVLAIVPYELGSPGTLLDQLELMRLLGALMAALTGMFTFLFVREALPGAGWAPRVGAAGVALAPLLGFMSGSADPDAMLFAVSAAILYCLARAFRRGLTPKLATAVGALTAVGLLTKLTFIGLAPGVILGLILSALRTPASERRAALRAVACVLGIPALPVCAYVFINVLSNHATLGFASGALKAVGGGRSLSAAVSYIWQFYLPRLPGMTDRFPGVSIPGQVWFDKSIGFYGWLDTPFPTWVDDIALIPVAAVAALCARELMVCRAALRGRLGEIAVYAAMGVGLMVLVAAGNLAEPETGLGFAQPRYLLPMLPLVGVVLALAARGAGRRWGPSVGVLLVVLVLAHDIFSQLLVVSRYYA